MARLRNFCFTINNYNQEDEDLLLKLKYQYIIIGKEGKGKTPHIQGYCELLKQTSFNRIKNYMPKGHIEARKGTQTQALEYCKKELDYVEFGKPREQGSRGDLDNIREIAAEQGMREVTSVGNAQQIAVAQKYLTYNEDKRDWKPTVISIIGPPGSGKSRKAREICQGKDVYEKMNSSKWWDGYDKHRYVIMDDFRAEDMNFTDLLRLLDRYSYTVEVKGGWRQMLAHTIILTSVKHLSKMYNNMGENLAQLNRRIDQIIDLNDYSEVGEGNTKTSPTPQNSEDLLWECAFEDFKEASRYYHGT